MQRCKDLKPRGSQQPSPYVVFKFFKFPDYPTATVHGSFQPHFSDTKSYIVCMDTELDQYLRQELIQFYVFDSKEQDLDSYMGKVRIPLLPLAQDQEITGEGSLRSSALVSLSLASLQTCFLFIVHLIFCFHETAIQQLLLVMQVLNRLI